MTQEHKLLEDMLTRALQKLDTTKSANVFTQGCVQASKDAMSSYPAYLAKKQEEYTELVKQGKMTVETANVVLGQLKNVINFLEDRYRDHEKINYVKQGELLAANALVNDLKNVTEALKTNELAKKQEAARLEVVPETVTVEPKVVEKKSEAPVEVVKKARPDELNTTVARAARDIKNRRKAALEFQEPAKRPGRPRTK